MSPGSTIHCARIRHLDMPKPYVVGRYKQVLPVRNPSQGPSQALPRGTGRRRKRTLLGFVRPCFPWPAGPRSNHDPEGDVLDARSGPTWILVSTAAAAASRYGLRRSMFEEGRKPGQPVRQVV